MKHNNIYHTGRMTAFALTAGLLLGSCVKDDLYHTDHPMQGAVKVTTDWNGRSADAVKPASYTLKVGDITQNTTADVTDFGTLLNPGTYEVWAYNTPEGITVNGTTATVSSLADGTLNPAPGYLYSGVTTLKAAEDTNSEVTVTMVQHIRMLKLILNLKDGEDARISAVHAQLSDVPQSIDLRTGKVTESSTKVTATDFVKGAAVKSAISRAESGTTLTAVFYLFREGQTNTTGGTGGGTSGGGAGTGSTDAAYGNSQLTVTFTMEDGSTQTVEKSLSDIMENFDEKNEPLELESDVIPLPVEMGVSINITDWTVIDNGKIDAN